MDKQHTNPLVSVIMPVYNGERYLREAIDSILAQTFTDFELIIVNDGSADSSEQIIQGYSDPRIRYLINERNSGICITLNKGLDAAQGKYIARMDCDDISMPERLAKQVAYMELHPEIGVVGSDMIVFGEGLDEHLFDFVHDKEGCKAGLLFATCFAHPSVMMRRDLLEQHHLRYDDAYRGLEDYELWYRISQYTELVNIPEPLLRYRKHKEQVTQNVTKKVSDKEVEFLHNRFLSYSDFTKAELTIAENYCFNRWSDFSDTDVKTLLSIFCRILAAPQVRTSRAYHRAMQITLSKALAFTCSNAMDVTLSRPKLFTQALFKGVMPFDWYLKFMYHQLLHR